jgi:hypothetical protein
MPEHCRETGDEATETPEATSGGIPPSGKEAVE